MKKTEKKGRKQSRRNFLKGTAATGAGALLATGIAKAVAGDTPDKKETNNEAVNEGYRLTEHIRDYYRTAAN